MKKLIIVGAGGFGREVLNYALDVQMVKKEWDILGFIDDNPDALKNVESGYRILGPIKDHAVKEDEVFICAMGDPKMKLLCCSLLQSEGARFINLIHPTAIIGRTSKTGQGLIMAPYSVITDNVRIGDFVTINTFSVLGHDSSAEDGCTLSPHCAVTGFTYLEEGVFLGCQATILPGVRVGKYAKVGAGCVVLKNVPQNVVTFGNPAKIVF